MTYCSHFAIDNTIEAIIIRSHDARYFQKQASARSSAWQWCGSGPAVAAYAGSSRGRVCGAQPAREARSGLKRLTSPFFVRILIATLFQPLLKERKFCASESLVCSHHFSFDQLDRKHQGAQNVGFKGTKPKLLIYNSGIPPPAYADRA